MFAHLFVCKKCGAQIKFQSFGFSSKTMCPQCKQKYIVVKNFLIRIIETFALLCIAGYAFRFMPSYILDSSLLTILIFCLILIVGNIIFDILLDHGLKIKNYYTLIEKTEPLKQKHK